jgi:5'-nucleotidase
MLFVQLRIAARPSTRTALAALACLGAWLLASCAAIPPAAPQQPVTVRLIAFNDFHGNLESRGAHAALARPRRPEEGGAAGAGGAAPLAGLVQALRAGAHAPHRRSAAAT